MSTSTTVRANELEKVFRKALTEQEKRVLYEAYLVTAQDIERAEEKLKHIFKPSEDFKRKADELYEMARVLVESMEQ